MKRMITLLIYNLLCILPAEILLKTVGRFHRKIGEGLRLRKGWERTLRSAIRSLPNEPRALFHVASAGELQQALPVIRSLKQKFPQWQFGISFYSVSGYSFFKGDDSVAFTTYMPFDSPQNSTTFMQIVQPKLYVVTAYDAWLNHCVAAQNSGAKLVMIAGILSEKSSRTRFPLRLFTKETFQTFEKVFTVSENDRLQIENLCDNSVAVEVAGDPRYDYIIDGISGAEAKLEGTPLPKWGGSTVMTLGSVWEPGWEIIGTSLLQEVKRGSLKLFIAPHEMHESFLKSIESQCKELGISCSRFTELSTSIESEEIQVIIVNTIGLLASLYSRSSLAYVGGAFGKGVHNVAEPAAFKLPLYFGTNFTHSLEARRSVESGAAKVVESADNFAEDLESLLENRGEFERRSSLASEVIHGSAGATTLICDGLLNYIERQ